MTAWATTKMSSKGQIVIPENIRKLLNIEEGSHFMVMGQGDAVILKLITPPSMEDFGQIIKELRTQARKAGLTKKDVKKAINRVRK